MALALVAGSISTLSAAEAELAAALARLRAIQPLGGGHRAAAMAAQQVAAAAPSELPRILAAMDGVNPIAENWLRGAAEAVAQRAGPQLPLPALEAFLADSGHSPRARRLAYELIAAVDPSAESRLIPQLLDDPSLELRRDAVAQALAQAAKLVKDEQAPQYEVALRHARDLDQIKEAAQHLKDLGRPADLARHMGYVPTWHVLGPFDNGDDRGWDASYPPESRIDLAANLVGQKGPIRWIAYTTTDDYGLVDLTKVLDKHKGAVAYAYAEFVSDRAQPCELRHSSPNAIKVWLNGQLVAAHHVYHAGDPIDQYVGRGTLVAGANHLLVKICQNEQPEDWAQRWEFRLRVCDRIGTAILAANRTPNASPAAPRPAN
jgi:hypothetical protein